MKNEKISVIIPVYNVKSYLNRCLESIVNQTYSNIMIYIIDDGSNDGSSEICDYWRKKDNRINVIHKNNEGLGPTRNLGLKVTNTEYILFVDSDDWLELDAIEKLYERACKYDADIVYMNFYFSYDNGDGTITDDIWIRHYLFDGVKNPKDNNEIIFDTDARMWSKLFRRSLFVENDLYMPAHPFEDFPIMPLLTLYAKRVCQIQEPLYHYYFKRKDNLIGNVNSYIHIAAGVKELYNSFVNRGFYDKYKDGLKKYIYDMCVFAVNDVPLRTLGNKEYETFLKQFVEVTNELVPEKREFSKIKVTIWGSYSNRLINYNLLFSQKQICNHYMFSAISGLNGTANDMRYINGKDINTFRLSMVKKEQERLFFSQNMLESDYCVIDFLEENNPIIKLANGYMTFSESFREVSDLDGQILDWRMNRNERWTLWIDDCNHFCEHLMVDAKTCTIILIKLYLATEYGTDSNNKCLFENIEEINYMNSILNDMYLYFEKKMEGQKIIVIDTREFDNYTYKYTKYGCIPIYSNGRFHSSVAEKVAKCITSVNIEKSL